MNSLIKSKNPLCQVCGAASLREIPGFADLPRITSDCRPFPTGGKLAVCANCGAVQKVSDATWLSEISDIYSVYSAYYQSDGDEQIIFDRVSGQPRRRSDVLMEQLSKQAGLTEAGIMLDVGCGNGVTLTSMSRVLPKWQLNGFEIGDGNLSRLSAIPGFAHLYTDSLSSIDKKFDLVTMIHSLEHFPDPCGVLESIRSNACRENLFIEVCNVDENPFDILVADHLMHFSPATLSRLLLRAGFRPVSLATDWVPKEISMVACVNGRVSVAESQERKRSVDVEAIFRKISSYVLWLQDLRRAVFDAIIAGRPFGLFGTSIAATWLAPQLKEQVTFFVDEDSSRVGREHLGSPVVHPTDVPRDAVVFLALAPKVAHAIASRLAHLPYKQVLPPV
jgi:hypothetical protein